MRTCMNAKCVAFGHIVFSVATRCPLCRWDLRRIPPASEIPSSTKAAQPQPSTN